MKDMAVVHESDNVCSMMGVHCGESVRNAQLFCRQSKSPVAVGGKVHEREIILGKVRMWESSRLVFEGPCVAVAVVDDDSAAVAVAVADAVLSFLANCSSFVQSSESAPWQTVPAAAAVVAADEETSDEKKVCHGPEPAAASA
mmetsp:Transcript_21599/g.45436  ORF Transcript_21599/g.45436 Transcript_21599/m.45436 type:complete len:143 (-) Transcript_21599:407-835(-)